MIEANDDDDDHLDQEYSMKNLQSEPIREKFHTYHRPKHSISPLYHQHRPRKSHFHRDESNAERRKDFTEIKDVGLKRELPFLLAMV